MAISKIVVNGTTRMDVTSATAAANDIIEPKTAMIADGTVPVGTHPEIDWIGFCNNTWPAGPVVLSSACETITKGAFANCDNLVSVSGPNVKVIESEAFIYCDGIQSFNFPEVTRIGRATSGTTDGAVFYGVRNTPVIHLPKCETAYGYGNFQKCGNAAMPITIVLPSLKGSYSGIFRETVCAAVDLGPNYHYLSQDAFYNGAACGALILRSTTIVSLYSTSSLAEIPTMIYIPKSLYDHLGDGTSDDYLAATNWSSKGLTVANFTAIEGSIYENAYADGTPIQST